MLNFKNIFTFLIFTWFACALCVDITIGMLCFPIGLILIAPFYVVRNDFVVTAFVALISSSVFLTCLFRIPILVNDPSLFVFGKLDDPSINDLRQGVIETLFCVASFYSGILILWWKPLSARFKKVSNTKIYIPTSFKPTILNNQKTVIYVCLVFIICRLLMFFIFGIGSLVGDKRFGFLSRIVPYSVAIFLMATYVVLYASRITKKGYFLIILYLSSLLLYSFLLTSKAAIAYSIFALFSLAIYRYGLNRLSSKQLLSFLIVIGLMIFFIFPFTQEYRHAVVFNGGHNLKTLKLTISNFTQNYDITDLMAHFSQRVSGFDGLVSLSYVEAGSLKPYYEVNSVFKAALQNLIPGVHFGEISCGKGVGLVYQGHKYSVQHSGTVGIFCSLFFMCGKWVYLVIFLSGFVCVLTFRLLWSSFEKYDLRYFLVSLYSFFCIRVMLTGNLDLSIVFAAEVFAQSLLIAYLLSKMRGGL